MTITPKVNSLLQHFLCNTQISLTSNKIKALAFSTFVNLIIIGLGAGAGALGNHLVQVLFVSKNIGGIAFAAATPLVGAYIIGHFCLIDVIITIIQKIATKKQHFALENTTKKNLIIKNISIISTIISIIALSIFFKYVKNISFTTQLITLISTFTTFVAIWLSLMFATLLILAPLIMLGCNL